MEISLNGRPFAVAAPASGVGEPTLSHLLALLDLQGKRVAIEVNGEMVPRGAHAAHVLVAGDRVEIVEAIGGG